MPDYKKTTADDLLNMQTGLFGYKGRVHFQVAPCINEALQALNRDMPKTELFAAVAALMDKGIHSNYRLYPNNYVASDLLAGTTVYEAHYTPADVQQRFEAYLQQQLAKIAIPGKDESFLRTKLLEMYANPLKNYLKATV